LWNIQVTPKRERLRPASSLQTRMEQGQRFRALYASLGFKPADVRATLAGVAAHCT
jgi:hypothetical protein